MGMIESVLEKDGRDGNKFWIAIIDGVETMAFDSKIKELKGKECPYPIGMSKNGKPYIQFPKQGGFQKGGAGGGWKGKSDKEIYGQILGTCMSYAKDKYAADLPYLASVIEGKGILPADTDERILITYRAFSKAILADLAKLVPDAPKLTEAPKTETKPPVVTPQETSRSQADLDKGTMTMKQKLEKEMNDYLRNMHSDNEVSFLALLKEISAFPEKNKETKMLTGKTVTCDNWERLSEGWAKTCLGKLRDTIEEEERQTVANADLGDVPY